MTVKLENVEDILKYYQNDAIIELSQNTIIKYLYNYKDSKSLINTEELRNAYIKSIKKSYRTKQYRENVKLDKDDIKKICFV